MEYLDAKRVFEDTKNDEKARATFSVEPVGAICLTIKRVLGESKTREIIACEEQQAMRWV